MVTYLDVIAQYYPTIQCVSINPNVYSDINWLNTPVQDIPSQVTLDTKILDMYKTNKITELSDMCHVSIISGFISNALGQNYIYDSEEVDQINILGVVSSTMPTALAPLGSSIYYACRNVATNVKSYVVHSHAQLREVLEDGADRKLSLLQQFHSLQNQVNACTTAGQVQAIVWQDP